MPVPKSKQSLYGKVVGANMNRGKSLSESKDIADKAIQVKTIKPSKSRDKESRERTRNEVQKVKKLHPKKLF